MSSSSERATKARTSVFLDAANLLSARPASGRSAAPSPGPPIVGIHDSVARMESEEAEEKREGSGSEASGGENNLQRKKNVATARAVGEEAGAAEDILGNFVPTQRSFGT